MATGDSTYNSQVPAAARPPAKPPVQGPTLPGQSKPGGYVPSGTTRFNPQSMPPRRATLTQRLTGLGIRPEAVPYNQSYQGSVIRGAGLVTDVWTDRYSAQGEWTTYNAQDRAVLNAVMNTKYAGLKWKQGWIPNVMKEGVNGAMEAAAQGTRITPLEYLRMTYLGNNTDIDTSGPQSSGGGGGGGGGGGSSSYTNVSIALTNPERAETLVNAALQTYLGRAANKKEREAFLKTLNRQENANPTVTQGSTVTSGGGHTSQMAKTTGGTDSTQIAEDFAMAQEGSAEYQAQTKYLGAFMSALENPMEL